MRLFVAAYPPAEVADDLERRLAGLTATAARRETWHVTLAFLGEIDDALAPTAAAAVERAADGPPVSLRLAGGGHFGSAVLWAGVTGDGLDDLATRVRREIDKTGLPYDRKPFRPHLTVARRALPADLELLATYRGPVWPVTEIRLVRSQLGSPPTYSTFAAFPLAR